MVITIQSRFFFITSRFFVICNLKFVYYANNNSMFYETFCIFASLLLLSQFLHFIMMSYWLHCDITERFYCKTTELDFVVLALQLCLFRLELDCCLSFRTENVFYAKRLQQWPRYILLHMWKLCSISSTQNITPFVKNVYYAYFGIKLEDQDKAWAPHKVCRRWGSGALASKNL